MTQRNFDQFPAADLDTNKAGRITDAQRRNLRSMARPTLNRELTTAFGCIVVAAILLTQTDDAPSTAARPIAGVGFLVLAALFLFLATPFGEPLAQDLRGGRVETVEGAFGKRAMTSRGRSGGTSYYFDVAGRSFEVGDASYHAASEAGVVRLYVLPRSHAVVNMERLPERPMLEGAPTRAGAPSAVAVLPSHDRVQAA